jgi:hypothetical protein
MLMQFALEKAGSLNQDKLRDALRAMDVETFFGKFKFDEKGKKEIKRIYQDFYKDAPFVRVTDSPPHTKHTWGNNDCIIYPTTDPSGEKLIVISALDNLVKGAAGQAIQNMNLMLGLPMVTWIRFAVWLLVGLVLYFTYGFLAEPIENRSLRSRFMDQTPPQENMNHTGKPQLLRVLGLREGEGGLEQKR